MDTMGNLEAGEQLAAPLLDQLRRDLGPSSHNGQFDDLAQKRVRSGKGRTFPHPVDQRYDSLNLPREDVLPRYVDHVLAAARDVQSAGIVEVSQIAASEKAIRRKVLG